MPSTISRDLLKSIGISENIIPRVFATLRFLDLVTLSSEPSDVLRGLAGSTEDEYHQLLEKTVRWPTPTTLRGSTPAWIRRNE